MLRGLYTLRVTDQGLSLYNYRKYELLEGLEGLRSQERLLRD